MADTNLTNQDNQRLSKLSDNLGEQVEKLFNIDALLSCAAENLLGEGDSAESARRVICIAKGFLADIRNQIDSASLEASLIQNQAPRLMEDAA